MFTGLMCPVFGVPSTPRIPRACPFGLNLVPEWCPGTVFSRGQVTACQGQCLCCAYLLLETAWLLALLARSGRTSWTMVNPALGVSPP